MKKHDLQPTDDNIRNTFYNDLIGRNKDLVYFIRIIDSINESYSIALDSYWGSGKTFFVKQVKMILDANNEFTYDAVKEKDKVISKWNSLLGNDTININCHIPIYYDAWSNDNDKDPILSIIYQIIQTVGKYADIKEQKGLSSVFALAGDIFELVKGFNPLEIAKKLKGENPLEEIMQAKSLQEKIDEFIESLIPEHGERLLIIIDELDRCNPEFAVKLLERIKHYFNNDRVTFVFAVNLAELQHTIKHHYGVNFNASRYLDRFFDLPIKLPAIDIDKFIESQDVYAGIYDFDRSMKSVIKKYNLQLREILRYITISKYIVANEAYFGSSQIRNARNVIIHIIIPIVSALIITENKQYLEFVNGNDSSPLLEFYEDKGNVKNVIHYLGLLLSDNPFVTLETLENSLYEQDRLKNLLNDFYNALFNKTEELKVGKCTIDNAERDYLKNVVSLLSDNTIKMIAKEEIGV